MGENEKLYRGVRRLVKNNMSLHPLDQRNETSEDEQSSEDEKTNNKKLKKSETSDFKSVHTVNLEN